MGTQANVLIDDKLHACLADFGLSAVTYDPNTVNAISTSSSVNGSIRWMAPELLNPEEAGLEHVRPSSEADIYAFSMLMWEVSSLALSSRSVGTLRGYARYSQAGSRSTTLPVTRL